MADPQYSPAESLMSVAGDSYTSLFPETMAPKAEEPPTPDSHRESSLPLTPQSQEEYHSNKRASQDSTDDKPAKKPRKTWGQVLPEPKTSLPPRKRAKTEDEKEQRRIERVLRNRRAAQSSRERKRKESELLAVENDALQGKYQALQAQYDQAVAKNASLLQFLDQLKAKHPQIASDVEPFSAAEVTVNPKELSPTSSPATNHAEKTSEISRSEPAVPSGVESKPESTIPNENHSATADPSPSGTNTSTPSIAVPEAADFIIFGPDDTFHTPDTSNLLPQQEDFQLFEDTVCNSSLTSFDEDFFTASLPGPDLDDDYSGLDSITQPYAGASY
ncbi:transcriptional activator hac1 [Emericellopsis cladophorae]|uniref:Transcriptional activator hac1 n=1 Tax=Emericellopsis cladophorae TaxID=2686198 RepID=A0A9P9XZ28_9HYPO|nr:transcriptional activator hac1 [Emericellopsis cladophorae]KAI6780534.1 transcriptional activator hac1 [Emericellopsis cladophorae]